MKVLNTKVYNKIILCNSNRLKANRKRASSAVGYPTEQITFSARALRANSNLWLAQAVII